MKDIPGLPPLPSSPSGWHDWQRRVLEHRVQMLMDISQSEAYRAREAARCDRSFLYMANTYGVIYEARGEDDYGTWLEDEDDGQFYQEYTWVDEHPVDEDGNELPPQIKRGGVIPFIMYPFQVEFSMWMDTRMRSRGPAGDGAVEKARDMGVTNTSVFWFAHKWLYRRPFQGRLLSRKEDLVDRTGDPDSMFWKIDTFLMGLPAFLLQYGAPGFDWSKHRQKMLLINPSNQNLISGESTNVNAGRGGRCTAALADEAAFMEEFAGIWSALRASTYHRIIVTTPSTAKGMDCYNIIYGEGGYTPLPRFTMTWDLHPEHDRAWYDNELERDGPQKFAQEVLIDWFAGSGEWVYPEARDITIESGRVGDFPFIPGAGEFLISIDDGFDDDWGIVFWQYIEQTQRLRVLDSYSKSHMPADFYGSFFKHIFLEQFDYDLEARRIMHWLRTMPPGSYYGDAHGAHVEQVSGTSVYTYLADRWGINVNYYVGPDGTKLTFPQRRLALGKILPTLDVNNTTGALNFLQALKNHRFKATDTGPDTAYEQKQPVHTKWSHLVSSAEYLAVQMDTFKFAFAAKRGEIVYARPRKKAFANTPRYAQ